MMFKQIARAAIGASLVAACLGASAQPPVPEGFKGLPPAELAKQCFFRTTLWAEISQVLWESSGLEAHQHRTRSAASQARVWRSRFSEYTPEERLLSLQAHAQLPARESALQLEFCSHAAAGERAAQRKATL